MTLERNANAVIDDLVPAVYVGMYVCACVGMCTYVFVRMCAKCAYTVLQYCIQCVQLFVALVVYCYLIGWCTCLNMDHYYYYMYVYIAISKGDTSNSVQTKRLKIKGDNRLCWINKTIFSNKGNSCVVCCVVGFQCVVCCCSGLVAPGYSAVVRTAISVHSNDFCFSAGAQMTPSQSLMLVFPSYTPFKLAPKHLLNHQPLW